jgi:hypothetical protein
VPDPERALGERRAGPPPARGTPREYAFGLAIIEFLRDVTAGRVIFGSDDVEPLLGVTALESTGVIVDPKTRTLKRLPAIPLQ